MYELLQALLLAILISSVTTYITSKYARLVSLRKLDNIERNACTIAIICLVCLLFSLFRG